MPERPETRGDLTQPLSAYQADIATTANTSDGGNVQVEESAASAAETDAPSSAWFTSWNTGDAGDTTDAPDAPAGGGQAHEPVEAVPQRHAVPGGTVPDGTLPNGVPSVGAMAARQAPSMHAEPRPQMSAAADQATGVEPQLAALPEPPVAAAHPSPAPPAAVVPPSSPPLPSPPRPAAPPQPALPPSAVLRQPTAPPQPALPLPAVLPQPASPLPAVLPQPPSPQPAEPAPPPVDPAATRAATTAATSAGSPTEWPTEEVERVEPVSAWAASASDTVPPVKDAPQQSRDHARPPTRTRRPTDTVGDDDPPVDAPLWRQPRILIVAAVVGVLALLYVVDLVLSHATVPRGVTVAGVSVGGMDPTEAETLLRSTIQPRTTRPIPVRAGDVQATIDPRTTGLQINWDRTLADVDAQPLNPWTRFITLFGDRQVGVATTGDPRMLAGAITQLVPTVDRPPVEGNVRFEGTTPLPVDPKAGYRLDQSTAADVLRRDWVSGAPVVLPMLEDRPTTTSESVKAAIEQVATPAVSRPFTIAGEKGKEAEIEPSVTASALHFVPDGSGGLRPDIETARIVAAAEPELASTEQPGRDASLALKDGRPVVTPSVDGRGIDYAATFKPLVDVLRRSTDRRLVATYGPEPAKLTTEDVNRLGITDVIGEFTTSGFAADSGMNIRRAAQAINGTVLKPGETFSLNGATGPRNAGTGYVDAGIIQDNHPARGIGGGVSQLATTTYNAAYFAGMTDITHTEHSFYISRYPAAREATVFEGEIDLKFRNDNPTGVLVQTVWTPSTITVRIYGAKRYDVTSTPGPRINPTDPGEVTIPAGQPCSPSDGTPGFTTSDTRTLRDIRTGETKSHTRNVTYKPAPKVICAS